MTSLFLTISGYSGGNSGPQGVYKLLENDKHDGVKIVSIKTIPNKIEANVQLTCATALKNLASHDGIYLVGYSMGGAVAAQAAYELYQKIGPKLKGVVLLATQSDGLEALRDLNIPVLFYHGKKDSVCPAWQTEGSFRQCIGNKKMIEIEGLDHDLGYLNEVKPSKNHAQDLARDIFNEISTFFLNAPAEKDLSDNIISKELPRTIVQLQPKKGNWFSQFFSFLSD